MENTLLCSFCHTFFIIESQIQIFFNSLFLQGTPSSFSTTTTDYSTTSFKDAQIQYRPYGSYKYHKAEATVEEDVPMPMIDIQLPFNNHSHIVTWLDPDKMSPKLNRDLFQVILTRWLKIIEKSPTLVENYSNCRIWILGISVFLTNFLADKKWPVW